MDPSEFEALFGFDESDSHSMPSQEELFALRAHLTDAEQLIALACELTDCADIVERGETDNPELAQRVLETAQHLFAAFMADLSEDPARMTTVVSFLITDVVSEWRIKSVAAEEEVDSFVPSSLMFLAYTWRSRTRDMGAS